MPTARLAGGKMTCSFLMQSWLSLRYLCPSSSHTHTHIDFTCKTYWSLSSNTPLKNRFDTPTYSIENLIHTDLADINCIQTGFSNRNWLKCNILLYTTQYTETKDTASNKQGTNCFLRWDSSRSWLAGRATGHRPTLRKWETPLWGWSLWHWVRNINNNKMLRFFFFLCYISILGFLLMTFLHVVMRESKRSFQFGHLERGDYLSSISVVTMSTRFWALIGHRSGQKCVFGVSPSTL